MGSFTNFPGGVTSLGIPVIPNNIPFGPGSKVFFVAPDTGGDGNDGSLNRPLATLAEAHDRMRANKNDVCFLIAQSNTAADTTDYQSATLNWSKDLCHLVGVGASSKFSHRSRIGQLSTATGLTSLVTVSADGCHFSNFSIFHGVADATSKVALKVTGTRNVFERLHIAGMGDTSKTQSVTGAASLWLSGASENVFRDCVIGLDTATRDADGTEILCETGASRNAFEDCLIDSYIDAAGFAAVTIGANGIDRGLYFKNCLFMAKSTNKAVAQTSVFSIPAISQGAIILQNTKAICDGGAAEWDSNNRGIIWNDSVAAAASAAGGILTNQ
jgi:hypothetical protein